MKLRLIFLSKTRNPHLRTLLEDYRQRLARFSSVEIIERRSVDARKLAEEGSLVLLDPAGQEFTSEELARWLDRQQTSGQRQLTFLLGEAEGFPDAVRRSAGFLLSLSKLTFPHELARVVLLEQLYRACARLHGHPYPK